MRTLKTCLTLAVSSLVLAACCAEPEAPPPQPRPAPPPPPPTACKWPTKASDANVAWSTMAYPTGDSRTSAVGVEKGMPREARVNVPFDYWIVVTNITGNTLDHVTLTEEFGDHFNFQSASPAPSVSSGKTVRWDCGTLAPCESKVITVKATATQTGTVTSCSSVTYSTALCMGVPVVQPALLVTLNGPAQISQCDVAVYNIEVTNTGTGLAKNVNVKHHLPAGMVADVAEFVAGDMAPGQKKAFRVVANPQRTGQFIHKTSASGEGGLAHETTTITTIVRKPVLKITRVAPEMRFLNREIEVKITVENTGDGVAQNTVIEDVIGPNGRFVSASDGGVATGNAVVWNLGDLAPGAKRTVEVTYMTTGIADHEGTTSVVAVCADKAQNTSRTVVRGIAGMLLEGRDDPDPIEVGKTTTYYLEVVNQGSAPLTQVEFWCTMDEDDSMELVSATGNTPGGAITGRRGQGRRIDFPTIATIPPGQKATFEIVIRALRPDQAQLLAETRSAEITRVLQKLETTHFYE